VPAVTVVYYRERGQVPMVEWLAKLPPDAADVCVARVRLLRDGGCELRRPFADLLRDGIHELRAKRRGINYRMFYFFFGRKVVVVSHGFLKQRARVPEPEIDRAVERMTRFKADPFSHAFAAGV